MTKGLYVGVDPGKNGAVVIIDCQAQIVDKSPMFVDLGGELDPVAYYNFLSKNSNHISHVFVEKVNAMPGQGVTSMFSFGQAFMFSYVVPKLMKLPLTLVTPQSWQKVMHEGIDKTLAAKKRSLIAFNRLFPGLDLRKTERCKGPHDGMIDALLLANYGRLKMVGVNG